METTLENNQENNDHAEKTDAAVTVSPAGAIEQDDVAIGTDNAGRYSNYTENVQLAEPGIIIAQTYPRRETVKGKKHSHPKDACGKAATGKQTGQHVPRGTTEVAEILRKEGYTVGKVLDPESPFDLMGWSHAGSILVRVARPREPVANARDVKELYEPEIRHMEPYYRSEADNIQFLVISREHGLLRYRVYDWGIGNVATMQKIMKIPRLAPSDKETAAPEPANRRARSSPGPDAATGRAGAPDSTPVPAL